MSAVALSGDPPAGRELSEAIRNIGRVGSRTDLWFAFVPVRGPLSVCVASRGEAIESVKNVIRSYVDRAATDGPRILPESYEEVLEVEVEVPLKGVLT